MNGGIDVAARHRIADPVQQEAARLRRSRLLGAPGAYQRGQKVSVLVNNAAVIFPTAG